MALDRFSEPVRAWFEASFAAATPPQEQGWPAIADGHNALILAPTGSGKTLSAFLWGIDQLVSEPTDPDDRHTRILYISPLRALAVDVEKNLRAPLTGIRVAADRLGVEVVEPTVGIRTGDTPPDERRRLVRSPPDILITTPESLYLMLTSKARETLTRVDAVIIDEIHALAATKRGAHLSLSLERLEAMQVERGSDGDTPSPERLDGASEGAPASERPVAASVAGERDSAVSERLDGASEGAPASERPVAASVAGERDSAASVAGERDSTLQRIGLSATQRPLEEIADFLVGRRADGSPRPVRIVDAGIRKVLDIEVVVPVDDMAELGTIVDEPTSGPAAAGPVRRSIWPAMHPELLELVKAHHSTLIFVNARRLAERLAIRLNELHVEGINRAAEAEGRAPLSDEFAEGVELVRAHHGSLSRERRLQIEDDLKAGRLKGLVATSSLELGIDMGAVDLVIQVESPGAVSRGLQRIGRAGHQVGQPSTGKLFPKHRHDLLEAAVVVKRMVDGEIEHTHFVRNPLDVLSQQIVAMCALDEWSLDDVKAVIRGSANFAELSDDVLHSVLDLLAGRYPSEEFGELRPRIVWDRIEGVVRGRAGAQRLAVTNAGTIPDRGLFGVFLPDGTRVGELDEEMVYESRPGETFLLGASTWRIEDITFERVVVTPAPGQPGKMPFWHGDGPGRPLELGQAIGAFVREIRTVDDPVEVLRRDHGLDPRAATNLVAYLDEQAEATGALPDDRTIVVERFRDEIGDWRICVLSPFGAQVHAPWGMALQLLLAEEWGMEVELMWSDDGIVLRLPEAIDEIPVELLTVDPDELEELLVRQLPQTAMFASRFRECAGRALLLPRRRPDRRTPLWQQRQKAADLLGVAAKYPTFPMLLEATRECMNDVFDVPALKQVLTDLRSRRVRMVTVETDRASPFAQSLMFGWIAVYMYEGDAPLAERRAAALSLDRDLLRELLGAEELRELIDPEALADLELELQCLVEGRRARDADEVHDLLRRLGPLSLLEIDGRTVGTDADALVAELEAVRRAYRVNIAGEERIAAAEDAGRLRDALGVAAPMGLPIAFTEVQDAPWVEFGRALRQDPRAVRDRRPGAPVRRPARSRPAGTRGARSTVAGCARRVPARRCRSRVVRRRRPEDAAASLVGSAASRGRTGRRRCPGAVPPCVAPRREPTAVLRCPDRLARPAVGCPTGRLGARGRSASCSARRVPPRRPRPTLFDRRDRLDRCRVARRPRRPRAARLSRSGPAARPEPGRGPRGRCAVGDPRSPHRPGCVVLDRRARGSARRRPRLRRRGRACRVVGSCVGGARHQRLAGAAPFVSRRSAPAVGGEQGTWPPASGSFVAPRPAGGLGPVVRGGAAAPASPGADRGRPRAGPAASRTLRRVDP